MLDVGLVWHGGEGAHHVKESESEVIVYEEVDEVHNDEETKRPGPSGL